MIRRSSRAGTSAATTWSGPSRHSTSWPIRILGQRRGPSPLVREPDLRGRPALRPETATTRSASTLRSIPDLPYGPARAIRSAASTTSSPPSSRSTSRQNRLIRFSDDFGGETNVYQGFDVNLEGRLRNGGFLKFGRRRHVTDVRQLQPDRGRPRCRAAEYSDCQHLQGHRRIYPDGTTSCHREYPFRPDAKLSGAYTLPWGIYLAGTYQFSRGVQTGGTGPAIQANLEPFPQRIGGRRGAPPWNGVASRTIQLIREGLMYGDHNLSQSPICG